MKLRIVPAALAELQAATTFYAATASLQVARAFVAEFERATDRLLANPQIGSAFRGKRRQYSLRKFPYFLIYQVNADELRVVALAHQRRRPA